MQEITGAKPARDASFTLHSGVSSIHYSNHPSPHFSFCSRSPTAETRRRERRQCRCESRREHQFTESKPQQTGTGLLIRHGEVATTSGSTNSLPRGVTAACRVNLGFRLSI